MGPGDILSGGMDLSYGAGNVLFQAPTSGQQILATPGYSGPGRMLPHVGADPNTRFIEPDLEKAGLTQLQIQNLGISTAADYGVSSFDWASNYANVISEAVKQGFTQVAGLAPTAAERSASSAWAGAMGQQAFETAHSGSDPIGGPLMVLGSLAIGGLAAGLIGGGGAAAAGTADAATTVTAADTAVGAGATTTAAETGADYLATGGLIVSPAEAATPGAIFESTGAGLTLADVGAGLKTAASTVSTASSAIGTLHTLENAVHQGQPGGAAAPAQANGAPSGLGNWLVLPAAGAAGAAAQPSFLSSLGGVLSSTQGMILAGVGVALVLALIFARRG